VTTVLPPRQQENDDVEDGDIDMFSSTVAGRDRGKEKDEDEDKSL
jgi:hypothetical protein